MALVSVREVSHSFGVSLLFDNITLHIERGERVCLLGRNGAGKSTLMQLIDGALQPDDGAVMRQRGAKIAHLAQTVPGRLLRFALDCRGITDKKTARGSFAVVEGTVAAPGEPGLGITPLPEVLGEPVAVYGA